MAKRRYLHHVVAALEFQSDQLDLLDDRFVEFQQELAQQAKQQALDSLEARREMAKALGGRSSGPAFAVDLSRTQNETKIGDPVIPSKEAGIVAALGSMLLKGGLGIGAATAGIGYLVSQINDFGPSLSRLSTGLADLENTEVTGAQFKKLGAAIAELVSGAGIGGALGIRILSGAAFTDMAKGLSDLDKVEVNPDTFNQIGLALGGLTEKIGVFDAIGANIISGSAFTGLAEGVDALNNLTVDDTLISKFETIGKGVDALIDELPGLFSLGEASILQAIDDNLVPLADGVSALTDIDAQKFSVNAPLIGGGISTLMSSLDDLTATVALQGIDDNLKPLADGINALNAIDAPAFSQVTGFLGPAFQRLLDGTDDIVGAIGLQGIDDNLIPLADGIRYVTDTVNDDVQQKFLTLSNIIGPAFQKILDGTDDLLGAVGLQGIDDNLIPMADGIKYMSDVGSEIDISNMENIVGAYNALADMKSISPAKIKNLAEMLTAVAPVQSQRLGVIQENTVPSQTGTVIVNNNTNAPTSVQTQTSVTNQAPSLGSPTMSNGSRADAYGAV